MSSSKNKWSKPAGNSAQTTFKRRGVLFISFILLLGLLASCNSSAATPTMTATLTPSATATITYTPTPSSTPTQTLTPTLTPTPIGGGKNYIFAYASTSWTDETYHTDLIIELPDKTLNIPLGDSDTPYVAISPMGDVVVTEFKTETSTDIIAIYVHETPVTPVVLTSFSLPNDIWSYEMTFSPDGKWLSVKYDIGAKEYYKFVEMETGRVLINYDCKRLATFALDNIAYCQDGSYYDDYGKLDLTQNYMNKSFLELPNSKMFFASEPKQDWHAEAMLPSLDAFIMRRGDGALILADQLEARGKQTFWDSDQIDDLIASHILAEIPYGAYTFQYLLSPDGKQIAVTGINSRGFGTGPGIDRRTFTFVTSINETYHPQDDNEPGKLFYALAWSPDSKALIGLSGDGTTLSVWDAATMNELEVVWEAQKYKNTNPAEPFQRIQYLNLSVRCIAAVWLP